MFEIGDRVVCIDASIRDGKDSFIYTVTALGAGPAIRLEEISGFFFWSNRFGLYSRPDKTAPATLASLRLLRRQNV